MSFPQAGTKRVNYGVRHFYDLGWRCNRDTCFYRCAQNWSGHGAFTVSLGPLQMVISRSYFYTTFMQATHTGC